MLWGYFITLNLLKELFKFKHYQVQTILKKYPYFS